MRRSTSEPGEATGYWFLGENDHRVVGSTGSFWELHDSPAKNSWGCVHPCLSVGSCTKAPWDISHQTDEQFSSWAEFFPTCVWTHEPVHCCARPGQMLIRFLLTPSPRSSKQTVETGKQVKRHTGWSTRAQQQLPSFTHYSLEQLPPLFLDIKAPTTRPGRTTRCDFNAPIFYWQDLNVAAVSGQLREKKKKKKKRINKKKQNIQQLLGFEHRVSGSPGT